MKKETTVYGAGYGKVKIVECDSKDCATKFDVRDGKGRYGKLYCRPCVEKLDARRAELAKRDTSPAEHASLWPMLSKG